MLYANQTLYHKITKKIVALCPENRETAFHWQGNRFIDEDGAIFFDSLDNYNNFTDFFDRPATYTKEKSTSEFVDTTLKKYLVSDEERARMFEIEAGIWFDKIISKLDTDNYVHIPFADGSFCTKMRNYFRDKVRAVPIYERKAGPPYIVRVPFTFTRNNKTYLLTDDEIVEININV